MNRRAFIQASAAGAAVLSAGCEKVRAKLGDWLGDGGVPDRFELAAGAAWDDRTHLLNRAAFGPWPGDLDRVSKLGAAGWIEEQLFPEKIDDVACDLRARAFDTVGLDAGEMFEFDKQQVERDLTRMTVLRAVYSKRQLFEVMVEFWTDHFNIHIGKTECAWLKTPDDRDVVRKHALGKFRDLVRASALSPAMLVYLDGRENRKTAPDEKPNENYARELLELHTLGVQGGYTQKDVMEVARCLTGWYSRKDNQFRKAQVEFRRWAHDDGEKTVLGTKIPAGGMEQDLDRVLDIVCYHPSTALYVGEKLCRRFIADSPPASAIQSVARAFSSSGGDIRATLRALLASEEFRAAKGAKLKRPFRFIVSAARALGAQTNASPGLLRFLTAMGQAPFQHPTPDGYPDEAVPWLGTLMWRWNFALALATNSIGGTSVDHGSLCRAMGATSGSPLPHYFRLVLGRDPLPIERETVDDFCRAANIDPAKNCAEAVGLILASPAYQRC